jgi:hypothetical protein
MYIIVSAIIFLSLILSIETIKLFIKLSILSIMLSVSMMILLWIKVFASSYRPLVPLAESAFWRCEAIASDMVNIYNKLASKD